MKKYIMPKSKLVVFRMNAIMQTGSSNNGSGYGDESLELGKPTTSYDTKERDSWDELEDMFSF